MLNMRSSRLINMVWVLLVINFLFISSSLGCTFYPVGEHLRFIRVPEDTKVGEEFLQIRVYPRHNLTIQPIERIDDASYFSYNEINDTTVGLKLSKSLENLVDNDNPQNVLKFRMVCDFNNGYDTISSYLSVTVYVEDVNDHAPRFLDVPYHVTIDELTPTGVTIFRGIHAVDRDKPNTPNSDVTYTITSGNEKGKFSLESSHKATLVLKRSLDYDSGDKDFVLSVMASDRGTPQRNTTTDIHVIVADDDDQNPRFTRDVYKTQITEFYPLTGKKIHKELKFVPKILAYDADTAIDAEIHYDIIAGNENNLFFIDPSNGTLYLEKEIDLDEEKSLPGNTFVLQIQASQVDNPLKAGLARVEVEILDVNDNLPEFEVDLYNISIVENLPNGFSVLQVIATDKDEGENGEFTLQLDDKSRAFNIDSRTGWLTVRDQNILDREKQTSLTMKVYAKEKTPSVVVDSSKKSAIASVTVDVTLLDANDNNPTFVPSNLYEFRLPGDAEVGDIVGQVHAIDPDLGRNGMVLYDLQRSNTSAGPSAFPSFSVDAHTGHIIVIEHPLAQGRHALFVQASDQPSNPSEKRFSLAVVTVDVLKTGKSEFVPDFVGAPYEFWVGGDVSIGTSVGQVRVTDAVDKSKIIYDLLHSYHDGVPFAVEEKSGVITVVDDLKRFDRELYDFEALVTDERELTLVTNVTIHVVDPQDRSSPIIRNGANPIEMRVRENLSGALVGNLLHTNVRQNITNFSKTARFIIANQQDVADKFVISGDGTIYTQKPLDREERDMYRLTVIAENSRGVLKGAGVYQVTVIVEDENDNPPVFERASYEGHVTENSFGGAEVEMDSPIRAKDLDSGHNSQFKFTLHGEGSELFTIDQNKGKIFVRKGISNSLDREEKAVYSLRIVARDRGNLNSEVKLTIHVVDVNDNAPRFLQMVVLHDQDVEIVDSRQEKISHHSMFLSQDDNHRHSTNITKHGTVQLPPMISIPENIAIGTPVLRLVADDKDSNSTIKYQIRKELLIPSIRIKSSNPSKRKHFAIHPVNGEVTVARQLTPESEFRLSISAVDPGGLTDNVTVRIYVRDVNDHPPTFKKSYYDFEIKEGNYKNRFIGKVETTDGDYDDNANVTYVISKFPSDVTVFPFFISPTGNIMLNGEIDREERETYVFRVTATDHATRSQRLSSTVDVEIRVRDVNDNPPMFYGYDRIIQTSRLQFEEQSDNLLDENLLVPVYYTNVNENSPIGTTVARIFANDSDFSGNGNGLFLFDIKQKKNEQPLFQIDSKDGVVTIMKKLDFETRVVHNLTIVASDLGKPRLSSTAILVVNVVDVPEEKEIIPGPMFNHKFYEVEVEENVEVPMHIMTLNVTEGYQGQHLKYDVVTGNDSDHFSIDPKNGTLSLLTTPDREAREKYSVKIRVERMKRGRGMASLIYPPPEDKTSDLAPNEVRVIVRVKDVNDNTPQFSQQGRPIVAAIPTTANYGYQIVKLQASDPDAGINGEIRYQILGRADDDSGKFSIDPVTGQVRSVVSFVKDAGKVYGFDVKATDRRGSDSGRSAIANVFIYVLDDQRQVMLVLGAKPTIVERNLDAITAVLYNITGVEVRVRKIEPHLQSDVDNGKKTDLYLYGVDPLMNMILDMETLEHVLETKQTEIKRRLDVFNIVEMSFLKDNPQKPKPQKSLLTALEIAVVVLGGAVFVGAMATAVCVGCLKRGKARKHKKAEKSNFSTVNSGFTLNKAMVKSSSQMYPGTAYLDGICTGDTTDTYVEMHSNKSSHCGGPKRRHRHDPACHRHHRHHRRSPTKIHLTRSGSNIALEASMSSLHSSGKDSGITEGRGGMCPCGHSTSHSSGDSSNGSYEDSLKSLHRRNEVNLQQMVLARRASLHGRTNQSLGPPPPPPAPPRIKTTPMLGRRTCQ